MAASSSSSASPASSVSSAPVLASKTCPLFSSSSQGTSIKLDRGNYMLWESVVLSLIEGNQLEGHIYGTSPAPSRFIISKVPIVVVALMVLVVASMAVVEVVVVVNDLDLRTVLFNKDPEYSELQPFGCACFPCLKPYNDHKFQFHSQKCVYLSPAAQHKGFKCLSPSGKVYISRHVVFDSEAFPFTFGFLNRHVRPPDGSDAAPFPLIVTSPRHIDSTAHIELRVPSPIDHPTVNTPTPNSSLSRGVGTDSSNSNNSPNSHQSSPRDVAGVSSHYHSDSNLNIIIPSPSVPATQNQAQNNEIQHFSPSEQHLQQRHPMVTRARDVGSLQYLTTTRLDISYSLNKLSQYMASPTDEHFQGVKRIFRNLLKLFQQPCLFTGRPFPNTSKIKAFDGKNFRCWQKRVYSVLDMHGIVNALEKSKIADDAAQA
ncbi:Retrovirus-related Pol polyprotein from transposon TNT 1-94 [Senna tora]|uniref:Retrovirus-related Pol polyprotein from transposon TNT 1-94 n=1 Tax=Senna tora TaxID=362788 RepID=A0A834TN47_9FABA|nr:Retrovirus-related Pol polyprotein from transposon TNT 1-94 [Senna tora]